MARTKKQKSPPLIGINVVKSEWHQVERRERAYINIDVLRDIYPDSTEEDLQTVLQQLADGDTEALDTIIEDDWGNGYLEFDWLDEDDWWTMRKGGYDTTYEMTTDTYEKD